MIAVRYHHSAVFDSERSRIYCFGGIGYDNIESRPRLDSSIDLMSSDNFNRDSNRFDMRNKPNHLLSCEYYDLKLDEWHSIEMLPEGYRQ